MGIPLLMTCPLPYAACASQRAAKAKPTRLTRLAKLVTALALLYVMFSGERWVLEQSPVATNELIVATSVVDVVFGQPAAVDPPGNVRKSEDEK